MLRTIQIALVVSVAAWGVLGAQHNLLGWEGALGAVRAVTSMSGFEGGPQHWQATANPAVVLAGAVFVVAFKVVSAVLCLVGGWQMWQARAADGASFARAKSSALSGCGVAVFGLFFGWTVLGEQLWELWRAPALEAAGRDAFKYGALIALVALFVAMRDNDPGA